MKERLFIVYLPCKKEKPLPNNDFSRNVVIMSRTTVCTAFVRCQLSLLICIKCVYDIKLLTMRTDARRLRCSCEDLAAREWKEKKYKLNKAILSKIKVQSFIS